MKTIITAVMIDEFNSLITDTCKVNVIDVDIQTQELLFQKLEDDDYKNADILFISDELSGAFSREELLEQVVKHFNGKIYVMLQEEDKQFEKRLRELKITNIFYTYSDVNLIIKELNYVTELANDSSFINVDEKVQIDEEKNIEKIIIEKKSISVIGLGGRGKTTVAINLAHVLKESRFNVCLIDCNFSNSSISDLLNIEDTKGFQGINNEDLTERTILNNTIKIDGIHCFTGLKDLFEIETAKRKLIAVITILKKHFDVVIVDTGNFTNDETHEIITLTDYQIFCLNNSELDLKVTKKYIELYKELGTKTNFTAFLNRTYDSEINVDEAEKILGITVHGMIKENKKIFYSNEKSKKISDVKAIKNLAAIEKNLFKIGKVKRVGWW